MCSNGEPFLPQDGLFDGCLLNLPPKNFYKPTVREAVKYWNDYASALMAMRVATWEKRQIKSKFT